MNNLKGIFHSLKEMVEYVEIIIIVISLIVLVITLIRSSIGSILNLVEGNNHHPFNAIKTDILKVSAFIFSNYFCISNNKNFISLLYKL